MDVWKSVGIAPHILVLGTDGGEWSDSRRICLTCGERALSIHWIRLPGLVLMLFFLSSSLLPHLGACSRFGA
jgi:hypothetical protein